MSNQADDKHLAAHSRRFASVVRDVKNAMADRDDVVVELREASRTRLELLATDLAPFLSELPPDLDLFDFTISSGMQPRLWIDAVSHVAMGHDRRTYRFVKDTRTGRVLLAEDTATGPIADKVARYVAERMLERERLMAGDVEQIGGAPIAKIQPETSIVNQGGWPVFLSGLGLVAAGALVGLIATTMTLWDRLTATFWSGY